MQDLLSRLKGYGVSIALSDNHSKLEFDYNDNIYDALSFDKANEINALIDDNEVDILAYLQNLNNSMVEIIKSTNELVGRIAGQKVEIEGKVIEVNELCFIVEAFGLLFQLEKGFITRYKMGDVVKITGTITGLLSNHTKPTYILIEHSKIEYIRTEAF